MAGVKVTMAELAEEYLLDCQARKLSPRTIEGYRKLLGVFLRRIAKDEFITTMDALAALRQQRYFEQHRHSRTMGMVSSVMDDTYKRWNEHIFILYQSK